MAARPAGAAPRRGARGFTLVELVVVVAIIAVVSALAYFSLGRPSASAQSSSVARDLFFSLNRVRAQATTSGFQLRLWICRTAGGSCPQAGVWVVEQANQPGMRPPTSWTSAGLQGVVSRDDAWVTEVTDAGGATLAGNVTIRFNPDGSAEGRTVEVTDRSGATRFVIRVFPGTGLVRLVQR